MKVDQVYAMKLLFLGVFVLLIAACGGEQIDPTQTDGTLPSPTRIESSSNPVAQPTEEASPTPSAEDTQVPETSPEPRFDLESLVVIPTQIVVGDQAKIVANVANVGDASGNYQAVLTIGEFELVSEEVEIQAGENQAFTFSHIFEIPGPVNLSSGEISIVVNILKPADFRVISLSSTPVVFPNSKVEVMVEAENRGDVSGNFLVSIHIDGVEADNRFVELQAGAIETVQFAVIKELPGNYEVSAGPLTVSFQVSDLETYTSDNFPFSAKYPADWTVEPVNGDPDHIFVFGERGFSQFFATVDDPNKSVETLYAELVEAFDSLCDDYQTSDRQAVAGDAQAIGFRFNSICLRPDGVEIRTLNQFMVRGSWVWYVGAGTNEALFEIEKPLLQSIIDGFRAPIVAALDYVNEEKGFKIDLPSGWDGWETIDSAPFLEISSPAGEPFVRVGVDFGIGDGTFSDQEIALSRAEFFGSEFSDLRIVSQGAVALGPGTQGYQIVYAAKDGGIGITLKEVSLIRGSQFFVIWSIGAVEAFENQLEEIDSLISSFTLIEPRPFGVSRENSLFMAGGTILTLDPAFERGSAAGHVGSIFSGLVALDRNLQVIPDLAERWEVSEDSTVYTFFLREGLQFHDGKPLTARDVKYSWERAADPATESPTASTYLGDIVGVNEKLKGLQDNIEGVVVIDDLTLRVTIDAPKQYFLAKLTYPTSFVVDRVNVQSGLSWTKRPNGSGPFKLKEWIEDELLIIEKNDLYYRGVPELTHVVFRLFAGVPIRMYEQDEIDIVFVPLNDVERVLDPANPLSQDLVATSGFEFNLSVGYIAMNPAFPPFDDVKVRQAFALALDMEKYAEVTLQGIASPATGILPPGMPGYNEDRVAIPFDPDLARQLILESKYGGVEILPPVTVYGVDDAFVSMWRDNLGVEVENIIITEIEEYLDLQDQQVLALHEAGWGADYPDPENFLGILFQSDSIQNAFGYSNATVDAALADAAIEQNQSIRLKMYQDIEEIVLGDWVVVPTVNFRSHVLVKPFVRGYFDTPMGIHILKDLSISRN